MEKKIIIRNKSKAQLIDPKMLLDVTVEDYLCTFHLENGAAYSCTKSLKDAMALLPDYFIQISRNCIVNIDKILHIELKNKKIIVSGGKEFIIKNKKALDNILTKAKAK